MNENMVVYTISEDGDLNQLDNEGQVIWTYSGHESAIVSLVVDKNGTAYTGDSSGEVHRVEKNGAHTHKYTDHGGTVTALAIDGNFIYAGSTNGQVHKLNKLMQLQTYTDEFDVSHNWIYNFTEPVFALATRPNLVYVGGQLNDIKTVSGSDPTDVGTLTIGYNVYGLYEKNNIVYYGGLNGEIGKIDGSTVTELNDTPYGLILNMFVDDEGNIYTAHDKVSPDGGVRKFDGTGDVLETYESTGQFLTVDVDVYGDVYYGGRNNIVTKVENDGTSIWTNTTHEDNVWGTKSYIKEFTVDFDTQSGSSVESVIVYEGDLVEEPEPTKFEHTLVGWYLDEEYTQPFSFDTVIENDITLYTKWQINRYVVFFESNGGSQVGIFIADYDSLISEPTAPTRVGYDFDGWFLNSNLTNEIDFDTYNMPNNNIVLYAKWELKEYTITFDSKGGSAVAPQNNLYLSNITPPASPTKAGYRFVAWYQDEEYTQSFTFDTMPAMNFTLYARWIETKFSIIIDNEDLTNKVSWSYSIYEKITYDLDEGSIEIRHSQKETPYRPFDIVEIYDEDGLEVFSGRVSYDIVNISSKKPLRYSHAIGLIEHTKLLERYWIYGKTFTQPIEDEVSPYTMLDVVEILRDTSVPSFTETGGSFPMLRPFSIENQSTRDFLDSVIAPELTFKEVNLREALNELFSFVDGLVRLGSQNEIYIDFFNFSGGEFNGIRTTKKDREQDINEYATTLVSAVVNPTNSRDVSDMEEYGNEIFPSEGLYTTPRSKSFIFDTGDALFPTPNPIYKINKVVAIPRVRLTIYDKDLSTDTIKTYNADNDYYELDLTHFIIEKEFHDSLDDMGFIESIISPDELNKSNTAVYEYGKRNIDLSYRWGLFNLFVGFPILLKSAIARTFRGEDLIINSVTYSIPEETTIDDGNIVMEDEDFKYTFQLLEQDHVYITPYRIYYQTIPRDVKIEIDRDSTEEINKLTQLLTNQKSRIVDTHSFLNNTQFTINKKGMSNLELSHVVKDLSSSYNLGDFDEQGFVITEKETIFHKDFYRCNYKLNRGFNKTSLFTGLSSQVRQWEIGESGRTLERNVYIKEYIEASPKDSVVSLSHDSKTLSSDMLGELGKTFTFNTAITPDPLNHFVFRSYGTEPTGEPFISEILDLTPIKSIGGNNVIYSFKFDNNVSLLPKLVGNNGFLADQFANMATRYTNNIGRFDRFNLRSFKQVPDGVFNSTVEAVMAGRDYPEVGDFFPIGVGTPMGDFEVYTKKDNREILKISLAYQVFSQDKDFVIGQKFMKENRMFSRSKNQIDQPKIAFYTNNKFTKNDVIAPDLPTASIQDLNSTYNNGVLTINNTTSESYSSWAIYEENTRKLWFACNKPINDTKNIHFEFKNRRGDIDYGEI